MAEFRFGTEMHYKRSLGNLVETESNQLPKHNEVILKKGTNRLGRKTHYSETVK